MRRAGGVLMLTNDKIPLPALSGRRHQKSPRKGGRFKLTTNAWFELVETTDHDCSGGARTTILTGYPPSPPALAPRPRHRKHTPTPEYLRSHDIHASIHVKPTTRHTRLTRHFRPHDSHASIHVEPITRYSRHKQDTMKHEKHRRHNIQGSQSTTTTSGPSPATPERLP